MLNMKQIKFNNDIITVCYSRERNDKNGNPIYHISVFDNCSNITVNYSNSYKVNKDGYIRIQTYDIDKTIETLIKSYV